MHDKEFVREDENPGFEWVIVRQRSKASHGYERKCVFLLSPPFIVIGAVVAYALFGSTASPTSLMAPIVIGGFVGMFGAWILCTHVTERTYTGTFPADVRFVVPVMLVLCAAVFVGVLIYGKGTRDLHRANPRYPSATERDHHLQRQGDDKESAGSVEDDIVRR